MSFEAYRWARANVTRLGLTSSERCVLLTLVDYVGERGQVWPSMALLCQETSLSRHTVERALRRLCDEGVLRVEVAGGTRQHPGSTVYRWVARIASPPATTADPPGTDCRPPRQPLPTEAVREPVREPSTRRRRARTPAPDHFEVTDELRQWARANDIACDLAFETEKFLDHHRAKGSLFTGELGWVAAWRTWMRNTLTFGVNGSRNGRTRIPEGALEEVSYQ